MHQSFQAFEERRIDRPVQIEWINDSGKRWAMAQTPAAGLKWLAEESLSSGLLLLKCSTVMMRFRISTWTPFGLAKQGFPLSKTRIYAGESWLYQLRQPICPCSASRATSWRVLTKAIKLTTAISENLSDPASALLYAPRPRSIQRAMLQPR